MLLIDLEMVSERVPYGTSGFRAIKEECQLALLGLKGIFYPSLSQCVCLSSHLPGLEGQYYHIKCPSLPEGWLQA